jgi:RHS repeat-associated protein
MRTRHTFDLLDRIVEVRDALERTSFKAVYDLAGRRLRIETLDAGVATAVFDAVGNAVETRDAKGALRVCRFDALNRMTALWARDAAGLPMRCRQRIVHGDSAEAGLTAAAAGEANLLGRRYKQYDEAGLLTIARYDFKGNRVERTRRVIQDAWIITALSATPPAPFSVDWQPSGGTTLAALEAALLDGRTYRVTETFDALNRPIVIRCPEDVDGHRRELRPSYDRAGLLERVHVDDDEIVAYIAYDAGGSRVLVAYGNGVVTRYAHDPVSGRLRRYRAQRCDRPAAWTFRPRDASTAPARAANVLQDVGVEWDLAGNVTRIADRTPGCGIPPRRDALDRDFAYDAAYRLVEASGRACAAMPANPWDPGPRCQDPTLTRASTEHFTYDLVGNLLRLDRSGAAARSMPLVVGTNRIASLTIGATVLSCQHDANGNLLRDDASRHYAWNHDDRLVAFRVQASSGPVSVAAQYLYDDAGTRVQRVVRKQGGEVEVTMAIDGLFEHRRVFGAGTSAAQTIVHVTDDATRVAELRKGDALPHDETPAVAFHLSDPLASTAVTIDGAGSWLRREEYTPYGECSFGGYRSKRFRFGGKERDAETGCTYVGRRYYAPWTCRWISVDEVSRESPERGVNPYAYAAGRPTVLIDPDGRNPVAVEAAAVVVLLGIIVVGTVWTVQRAQVKPRRRMAPSFSSSSDDPPPVAVAPRTEHSAPAPTYTTTAPPPMPSTPPKPAEAPPSPTFVTLPPKPMPAPSGKPALDPKPPQPYINPICPIGPIVYARTGFEDHHIFPQTFRDDFARIGIDIDDWTITMKAEKHRQLHNKQMWNQEWERFFQKKFRSPREAAQGAMELAMRLLVEEKLAHRKAHPFHKPNEKPKPLIFTN